MISSISGYEQFLELYRAGPEATYKLVSTLLQVNNALIERTEKLEARVTELEEQTKKNSRNSSYL